MCVVIQRYRKCPGALAPTTGHAPARTPNHRGLLAGALAQSLQQVCILVRYMCGSRRPHHAFSEQYSRHRGVETSGRPPPRWAAVAQGGVALGKRIIRLSRPLTSFEAKTRLVSCLARNTMVCLLARDSRTMPLASSTVAAVESQHRGDRRHGGPRSLKRESPFVCIT